MPLYEYKREDGTVFEIMQKLAEDPLELCPTTGQKVTRVISPVASHFKGEGFYETDYKTKKKPASKESKKPAKPD